MSCDCSAQVAPDVTNVLLEIKQQLVELRMNVNRDNWGLEWVQMLTDAVCLVQEPLFWTKAFTKS
jgi:hypothetical protein